MKKLIALVFALICVLSLVSCGSGVDKHTIEIIIPAGSTEAFVYSDEEISPHKNTIIISAGAGIVAAEVVLKPIEVHEENAYEPMTLKQKEPIKMDVEKGAWFKVGIAIDNPADTPIAASIIVKNVDIRNNTNITEPPIDNSITTYNVKIADNYPIENNIKNTYTAGEQVTIKLATVTEHYYIVYVNGVEQDMDRDASDLTYTYYTFTMPSEDVVVEIEDVSVEIPEIVEPLVSLPDFSFLEELEIYKEGDPGVKTDGFVNTTDVPVANDNEAIERAMQECTIAYDSVTIYLDTAECIWKVHFFTDRMLGGDQSVYLDYNGKTVLVVYRE